MNIFEQVKVKLCMSDVVRFYGLQINHSGMCSCPFHNDKTPSMKIYVNNFYCFGCGEHGDVIGFTAKLLEFHSLKRQKSRIMTSAYILKRTSHFRKTKSPYTITNRLNSVNI